MSPAWLYKHLTIRQRRLKTSRRYYSSGPYATWRFGSPVEKQISKPLALAYSPLGDKAKLEQMLVYATLQMAITTLPINADEFNKLLEQVKNNF